MLVIVTENVPPRLRGYLSRWLLEVRAGVYLGNYSVRVREKLWHVVTQQIADGNAVLAWTSGHESGFEFLTIGENCRTPVDWDGLVLVAYKRAIAPPTSSVDF